MLVLLLGISEDGRGQRKREGSNVRLWNECVPEKLLVAQRQVACVGSNLLSSQSFRILDLDFFQVLEEDPGMDVVLPVLSQLFVKNGYACSPHYGCISWVCASKPVTVKTNFIAMFEMEGLANGPHHPLLGAQKNQMICPRFGTGFCL